MNKLALIAALLVTSGCTTLSDDTKDNATNFGYDWSVLDDQPAIRCPRNRPAVCVVSGGRINKRFESCRCIR